MLRTWSGLLLALASLLVTGKIAAVRGVAPETAERASDSEASDDAPPTGVALRAARLSPADLEIGGDLEGVPPGASRYLTRDDLLALPQVRYAVSNDSNFAAPARIRGVDLEELAQRFGAAADSEVVIAICDDQYRAHYSRAYRNAHRPLLVLEVNGQPPAGWPKSPEGFGMGPYLISQPNFRPSFQVISAPEEAQIPWGVVRIELRDEKAVFGAIAPRGPQANDTAVQAGFRTAQQNCFRCHNMGSEGGQKAGLAWPALGAFAARSPDFFAAYVRNPQAANPRAQMEGSPGYDDAVMRALEAYFRTFTGAAEAKP